MLVASFIVPGAQIPAAIIKLYGGAKKVAELRSTYHTLKMQGIDDNKIALTLAIQYGEGKSTGTTANHVGRQIEKGLTNYNIPKKFANSAANITNIGTTEFINKVKK